MSPPRENMGAVPLAKLAEHDSSIHHIREQTDMDRRAWAERNRAFEERFQRIETATQDTRTDVAGLVSTLATVRWLVGVAVALVPICIGVAWTLGRLIHP